jgi:spermidine synthase
LGRTHKILTGVISVFAIGVIVFMPPWNKDWLSRGLFRMNEASPLSFSGPGRLHASALRPVKEMLDYADGPNTTVSIIESFLPKGLKNSNLFPRSIYLNGKNDGNTLGGDRVTTLLLAHIPALLGSGESESVAVVGFGTGLSIGAFTLYPNIKEIDCLEISPVVRDFAWYFDAYNHQVTKNPKVRWHIGDAYRFLKHVDKEYAIIMSEPSNPWVVGVERLFSQEFYEIVKGKLEKDGIYAQWVQTYNISPRTLGIVINTFASAFPFVRLFRAGSDILLIGSKASLNVRHFKNVERRFRIPSVAEELRSINVTGPESLLALEMWLPVEYFAGTEYHSLERPKLAFLSGKDRFYGDDLRVNDIMKKRSTRHWVRLGAENTLLAQWMSQKPEAEIESIKRALPVLCESKNVSFSPGWEKKSRRCRMAMLRLALEGELDSNGLVPERMLSGLKQLLEDVVQEVEPYGTVIDAYQAIQFFSEYDSIFLPLSPERLIEQVSICFETATGNAYICRSQLIEALNQTGRGELAGKYYEQLLRSGVDVPERIQMALEKGIREARRAGDAIRTSQGRKSLP